MDIKRLLEEDGFSCKYQAATYGGTYSSPCPWCGGKDRFRCCPNNGGGGNYFCQICKKSGRVKRYLMEYRGLDYSTATSLAGSAKPFKKTSLRSRLLKKNTSFKEPQEGPGQEWQKQALEVIENAANNIWLEENKSHVAWLNGRGITAETIKKHKLGFNIADVYFDRSDWGITGDDNNSSAKMIFPAGIVIPHFAGEVIHKIKIRCTGSNAQRKYHLVAGSITSAMVLGTGKYHIVVESELDGLLLEQEVGDLVTVVVLGSAQNRPDSLVMNKLRQSRLVLLALDKDKAGAQSSYDWWMKAVPKAKRWPVSKGKDPGEAYQLGVNIRDWVIAGIQYYSADALSTVNGSITVSGQTKQVSQPSIKQCLEVLSSFKSREGFCVDIITTGDDPFRDEISEIHISDFIDNIKINTGDGLFREAVKELRELFAKKNSKIVFYDAKTQLQVLERHDIKVNGDIFDQMLVQQLIYSGTKEISDSIDISKIKDSQKLLLEKVKENNLFNVFKLEMNCIPVIAQMELNGMLIDKIATTCLLDDLQEQLIPIQSELHDFFGDINLNSSDQLLDACKQKGIQLSETNRNSLLPLIKDYPILRTIIEYRQIGGYIDTLKGLLRNINPETGRVHPVYKQIVDTGRMSCSRPNIHSIPKQKEIRQLFIAPEGRRIIRADFSQIELRVAAEISQDSVMINAFNQNQDLHSLTASFVMQKPVKDISGSERQRAKAVNFGMLFGMGAKSLQESAFKSYGVYLTIAEATDFKKRFSSSYQGLTVWQENQKGKTETRTLSNRRRIWNSDPVDWPQLLNSPIQGTAADILKKSLVLLSERIGDLDAKIIGVVHDEILVEASDDIVEEVKMLVEQSMIEGGEEYLKSVPVKVDVADSDTWG